MISVTRVLSPYTDFSAIAPDVLEHAGWRGTEVHALCAIHARGLPALRDVPPSGAGYFLSFQEWFRNVLGVILVEPRLEDPIYKFCGHPDLLVRLRGDSGDTLVDLKTPAVESPTWKGQLAGYARLCEVNGYHITRVGSLRLRKDGGTARFTEYIRDGRDFAAFLAALTAYRFFGKGREKDD